MKTFHAVIIFFLTFFSKVGHVVDKSTSCGNGSGLCLPVYPSPSITSTLYQCSVGVTWIIHTVVLYTIHRPGGRFCYLHRPGGRLCFPKPSLRTSLLFKPSCRTSLLSKASVRTSLLYNCVCWRLSTWFSHCVVT